MQKHLSQSLFLLCLVAVQGNAQVGPQSPYVTQPPVVTISQGGAYGHFEVIGNAPKGLNDLGIMVVHISTGPNANTAGCYTILLNRSTVYLLSEDGTFWQGGYPVGSNNVIEHARCKVDVSSTSFVLLGATGGTFKVDNTFKAPMNGSKSAWIFAGDANWGSSTSTQYGPWYQGGPFTVNAASPYPVTMLSSPASGGSGNHQVFQLKVTDSNGSGNIAWGNIAFGTFGAGGFQATWQRGCNCVWVLTDNGSAYTGPATLGSNSILGNSQGSLAVASTSKSESGNELLLNFDITLAGGPFSGNRVVYGIAGNLGGSNGGWVGIGNWTIPAGVDTNMVITREFVVPPVAGDPPSQLPSLTQSGTVPNALRIYRTTDPIQVRVRFAKPNTQVWAQRYSFQDGYNPPTGNPFTQTVCTKSQGHDNEGLTDSINGACLLGTTDASGFLEWNGGFYDGIYNEHYLGLVTMQVYVGTHTIDPAHPGTTLGPMNQGSYIGALVYFIQDAGGVPVAPSW